MLPQYWGEDMATQVANFATAFWSGRCRRNTVGHREGVPEPQFVALGHDYLCAYSDHGFFGDAEIPFRIEPEELNRSAVEGAVD